MNRMHGIIFAYEQRGELRELTERRTAASMPFGGRYRAVDFALSNLLNAGVTDVGMVLHGRYQSMLDHVGSGKVWDMSRKRGGLHLLPPFNYLHDWGVTPFRGKMEALAGVRDYLDEIRSNLPVELRQAQSIVSDRAQLIESANAQAQAIVKKAEERARILVSEAEIVKAAQQRASEIVSAAQTEARTVRQTVTDYCDNMLKTTEETMAENAAQVKSVRANLRQSPRKTTL